MNEKLARKHAGKLTFLMHGKRSPKAHHWSERIVRQIEMGRGDGRGMLCVHACNGAMP